MRNRDSMTEGHQFDGVYSLDYSSLLAQTCPTPLAAMSMDLTQPSCSNPVPSGNEFPNSSNDPSAQRLHSNTSFKSAKMYPCEKCHKSFKQKTQLEQHHRVHSNARPYSCSYCEKSFKQRCHVDQHERIHTNERPYVCAQCGHAFRQKNHLDSHKKSHESGKK